MNCANRAYLLREFLNDSNEDVDGLCLWQLKRQPRPLLRVVCNSVAFIPGTSKMTRSCLSHNLTHGMIQGKENPVDVHQNHFQKCTGETHTSLTHTPAAWVVFGNFHNSKTHFRYFSGHAPPHERGENIPRQQNFFRLYNFDVSQVRCWDFRFFRFIWINHKGKRFSRRQSQTKTGKCSTKQICFTDTKIQQTVVIHNYCDCLQPLVDSNRALWRFPSFRVQQQLGLLVVQAAEVGDVILRQFPCKRPTKRGISVQPSHIWTRVCSLSDFPWEWKRAEGTANNTKRKVRFQFFTQTTCADLRSSRAMQAEVFDRTCATSSHKIAQRWSQVQVNRHARVFTQAPRPAALVKWTENGRGTEWVGPVTTTWTAPHQTRPHRKKKEEFYLVHSRWMLVYQHSICCPSEKQESKAVNTNVTSLKSQNNSFPRKTLMTPHFGRGVGWCQEVDTWPKYDGHLGWLQTSSFWKENSVILPQQMVQADQWDSVIQDESNTANVWAPWHGWNVMGQHAEHPSRGPHNTRRNACVCCVSGGNGYVGRFKWCTVALTLPQYINTLTTGSDPQIHDARHIYSIWHLHCPAKSPLPQKINFKPHK